MGVTNGDPAVADFNEEEASTAAAGTGSNNVNAAAVNGTLGETILATAGYDHTIKLWQINSALCVKTFQHPDSQVNDLCITPDRRLIAAAGYQHIRIYDVHGTSQTPTLNFEGLSKNVTSLGFNKDGQWMFSGGEDCSARIWDMRTATPQCQKVFQTHKSPITCAVLHPNQAELVISDLSGCIHVWDLRNDKNFQSIPDQNSSTPVQHCCIDPAGRFLAACNNKGDCYVWSLEDSEQESIKLSPFHRMNVHKRYVLKCRFSPDSSLLVTTSENSAKVWKMSDFSLKNNLECAGQRWVWDCAFTSDSQYLLTASSDNLARLWSLETGLVSRTLNGHQKPLTCVAFRDMAS